MLVKAYHLNVEICPPEADQTSYPCEILAVSTVLFRLHVDGIQAMFGRDVAQLSFHMRRPSYVYVCIWTLKSGATIILAILSLQFRARKRFAPLAIVILCGIVVLLPLLSC